MFKSLEALVAIICIFDPSQEAALLLRHRIMDGTLSWGNFHVVSLITSSHHAIGNDLKTFLATMKKEL